MQTTNISKLRKTALKAYFDALDLNGNNLIDIADLIKMLKNSGFDRSNPCTLGLYADLEAMHCDEIDFEQFCTLFKCTDITLFHKIFLGELVVPKFAEFKSVVENLYHEIIKNTKGSAASYIPELKNVNPNQFSISICTVDGQQFGIGDTDALFSIQSMVKPILYLLALQENGEKKVHDHVGREPSGHNFNELALNSNHLPHNPMINAGAIMSCSLIKPRLALASRFSHLINTLKKLCGAEHIGFNNAIYHSERETADRNFALGYFMREKHAFPRNTDLMSTLDLYFQSCSIEVNTHNLSILAATLANNGVCPISNQQVFDGESIKHCLSLMYSCGMYDYSGEWAFTIGLPAKSGVSGGIYIVVPGVMGICVWSPRIDKLGNSIRGVEFCQALTKRYQIHHYDSGIFDVVQNDSKKQSNPAIDGYLFLEAVYHNDIEQIIRLYARGLDINLQDYDHRTAMHIAASEGHYDVVLYLLNKGADSSIQDRWGKTALDNAREFNHTKVIALLKAHEKEN